MTDLEAAWDELHDALPASWVAGRPWYHDEAPLVGAVPAGAPGPTPQTGAVVSTTAGGDASSVGVSMATTEAARGAD